MSYVRNLNVLWAEEQFGLTSVLGPAKAITWNRINGWVAYDCIDSDGIRCGSHIRGGNPVPIASEADALFVWRTLFGAWRALWPERNYIVWRRLPHVSSSGSGWLITARAALSSVPEVGENSDEETEAS